MSFVITGKLDVQETIESLTLFTGGVQRSVIKPALVAAAKPMFKAAKARLGTGGGYYGSAGLETGLMAKAMKSVAKAYPAKNLVIVVMGPARGFAGTVTLDPDRIYRQAGGKRGSKGVKGVFGRTVKIHHPRADQLTRKEDPAKIGHLVEGGSSYRDAYPFMKPAFSETKAVSEAIFVARVRQGIEMLAARMPRRR